MSSKTTRFENLLEAVPDALVGMDQKGVIRFVNRQTESLFGYDRDELIGQPIETLVPEPLWQIYAEHREGYFADPRTRSSGLDLELNGRQRDGTEFPANISLSHIDTGDVLLVITAVRDVTKQKQAVKNAQLLAAIVQYSDDAIIGGTLGGIITSWNPAAETMYGYSGKEIIGKSGSLLYPDDRVDEMNAVLARIKDGQAVEDLETNGVRKDGTVVLVSITIAPIRDEDGEIVGASAVHRDVTEQRQAMAVAQRMAAIVESSDDAIIGGTLEGIITSWNPAAERLFGYSSEEIIGTSAEAVTPRDRPDEMQAILAKLRASQHIEHLETIRVRKDGTLFPVSLTVSAICDADGVIVGTSMISRDTTEMKHAVRYARSLIEAALDPLVTISTGGRITDVNEAMVKATGVPRDKLIGTDFSHYFTDPDKAAEGYQRVFAQGSVTDYPLTLRHEDGTLTNVLYNASVYRDFNGNVLGVFAAARDITKQKEAFEAAQRMAAIVEHSADAIFGNTLDGIITSWNPAAEKMYGYSSEEIMGQSGRLLTPPDRSREIISTLATISAGRPVKNFETIRIRKDGRAIAVSLTISPIRDEKSAVIGVSVICRDVTELKHAAQYTRSLIEAALDPLVTISPDGKITDVNESTVKVTGVPRNKLIGTDFSHYFTDPYNARRGYQRVFEQGSVTDYPLTLRHEDGTLTNVLYNASVYRDVGGNVLGVFAAARDITKQNEAFEAAQRMAAIIEYSDDAIIGSTLDGIITSWNPAAERMYGYSRDKIVRRSIDLLSPKDRTGEITAILAKISTGQSVDNFETICTRKDKTVFPVKLTIAPIRDTDGAVVGASAIGRDMTQQK
jgi:PAS domain S-box-containing protein